MGVQGLLDAYTKSLNYVELSEPNKLNSLVEKALQSAKE